MKKEEIQQRFMELQNMEEQIKLIQQHILTMNRQIIELNMLENSLDEIKGTEVNTDILIPLGSGIFTKAKLLDNKEVVMGVGANVSVKKTILEAKKVIKNQVEEMQKIMGQAEEQLQQIAVEAQHIQKDLTSEIEKSEKADS